MPIYIRLTVNGERMEISTKRKCEPEKWNSQNGRKNGTKDDTKILNAYLDTLQFKIHEIQRQIIESNLDMTAELVKKSVSVQYADVFKLKRLEIIDGIDGEKWLSIKRQKTDTPSRIPILPMAMVVLDKYQQNPQCVTKDKLLPVLSNQKMNSYLKETGDVCGVKKPITFHLARHTFATTVTLTNGVPLESVSKMLGHRNIKTTQDSIRH